jgi:hypothetical protein
LGFYVLTELAIAIQSDQQIMLDFLSSSKRRINMLKMVTASVCPSSELIKKSKQNHTNPISHQIQVGLSFMQYRAYSALRLKNINKRSSK